MRYRFGFGIPALLMALAPAEEGVDVPVDFAGTAVATSSAVGNLQADRAFTGTAAATSSTTGNLQVDRAFTGTSAATSSAAGNLTQYTPVDPLTIVTSVPWLTYLVADRGVTLAGSSVSAWADQSGNGKDATQAGGSAQPTIQLAALNGHNSILGDGTTDVMPFAGLDLPAPSATNLWFFAIVNQASWTANDSIYGGASTAVRCRQGGAGTPVLGCSNGTTGPDNSGASVGSWVRLENLFKNTTGDYLKLAATSVTGTNTGNTNPASGAFCLWAHTAAGAGAANADYYAFGILAGEPTAGEKSALSTWVTNLLGGSVGV